MSDIPKIKIEVDGKTVEVDQGSMIIEATDEENIYVPRFCYHRKLSIAANCRMCLVQVEKAPKPLPACATPVSDGMKVFTKSEQAKKSQKAVMEFLLINHPLDCPICDQGGECELQDLALGYGRDVSRFNEGKRVVADKNLGPLISTDLTRCILCTRCVRFGTEVAGRTELGAVGRGEFSKIRTFIESEVESEISGNVIDLCPVGALTSKPYRFQARAWELNQYKSISAFDSWGSNINYHVRRGKVLRCVPEENESINEVWLSDKDRFSYESIYHEERLSSPMIKQGGSWQEVSWDAALQYCADKLLTAIQYDDSDGVGALVGANSTTEEMFLLQKLMRSIGTNNIDHRLWQQDFSKQNDWPTYPNLSMEIEDIEELDAAIVFGGNINKSLPLCAVRLRKMVNNGGMIFTANPCEFEHSFDIEGHIEVDAGNFDRAALELLHALSAKIKSREVKGITSDIKVSSIGKKIAKIFQEGGKKAIFIGDMVLMHPNADTIISLLKEFASLTGAKLSFLYSSTNAAGAWFSGCIPHREEHGRVISNEKCGLNAKEMLEKKLSAYVLLNVELDKDSILGRKAVNTIKDSDFIVSMTSYKDDVAMDIADVILPISTCAENEGSYINISGKRQDFSMIVEPHGESKPAWKVIRVLANYLNVCSFDFDSLDDVRSELYSENLEAFPEGAWALSEELEISEITPCKKDLVLIMQPGLYATCPSIRRAESLQKTKDAVEMDAIRIHPDSISGLGEYDGKFAIIHSNNVNTRVKIITDSSMNKGSLFLYHGTRVASNLDMPFSCVCIKEVQE